VETCPHYTLGFVKTVEALQKFSDRLMSMKNRQQQTSYRKVLTVQILEGLTASSERSQVKLTSLRCLAGGKKANGKEGL
jgi:hypothetical protein